MFGDRLAYLRKQKQLSQYDLAERIGFSRGQLANYEQGKRQPDYETLQKIADFFEVSTDYLLGRSNKPNYNESDKDNGLAFLGGGENITEEEEEYLKESLELFRKMKSRADKNKD